jgi:hypothetical protein
MKISIGIDPGMTGAIAAINAQTRELLEIADTPTVKKKLYDLSAMADVIRRMALMGDAVVTLEQAQAMPGQGVSSTFSTGRSFGLWEGILGRSTSPFAPFALLCGQGSFSPECRARGKPGQFSSPCECSPGSSLFLRAADRRGTDAPTPLVWRITEQ